MTLGVDGLISGLNTTDLINSLMSVEAVPQTLLKNKVSDTSALVTALQGLNTQIASLQTLATTTAKPDALEIYTAKSSSSSLTATAAAGASTGSIDIVVGKLAQTQVGVTAAMADWPTDPAALTIVSSSGVATDITPASNSLDDIVDAVNKAGLGVSAMKVASGTLAGVPQYRIQFSSTTTGADAAFTVYRGTSAEVTGGTAVDLLTEPGAAMTRTAQDAEATLWAGTSAEQTITSSTNTFADLLPGVSVTATAVSTEPVTVTVARDSDKAATVASNFVGALTAIFATISVKSTVTSSVASTGTSTVSGGIFTSESSVRDVNQKLLDAASLPVNGISPSEIGVSITRDGTLEFDKDKFTAAMASDPDKVQSIMTELASRVAAAASKASDKFTGTLTTQITGQQSLVDSLGDQITDWDSRLAARRATLQATYTAMEVQLSAMNSQASQLTSALASLTAQTS